MKSGLLWYDAAPNISTKRKIEDAMRRYQEKFGASPNMCFVNPKALSDLPADELKDKVKIAAKPTILPNHFWVGISKSE